MLLFFVEGECAALHPDSLGLGGVVETLHCRRVDEDRSPSGAAGVLCSESSEGLTFDPENQAWRQMGGKWIGCWRTDPPHGKALLRGSVFGVLVQVAGSEWLVPRVLDEKGRFFLPFWWVIADLGRAARVENAAQYLRKLGEEALFASRVDGLAMPEIDPDEYASALVSILAVNHRIDGEIAAFLGLFDDPAEAARVISVAIGEG